ncbi:MAG: hypothetical protein Q9214_006526 [Letrouitia sp. 1 TL-2023]
MKAKLSREGSLKSFEVKGDLRLRIFDSTFTKVKLDLTANTTNNAQFQTHPNVDKSLFNNARTVQLKDPSKGFPINQSVGVLRWSANATSDAAGVLPITFTVWVNKGSDESFNIMLEYELSGGDSLSNVSVTIPYATSEPAVSSFDASYEVSGDSLEWSIGAVDETNASGAFEFEAQAEDEAEFFPMNVCFSKNRPFTDVDEELQLDKSTLFSIFARNMAGGPSLNLLAEKYVSQPINPKLLAYCPTMDLLAVATLDEQVYVYRLNGQKVFGVANRQAHGGVNQIKWKPNGQSIAVAFSSRKICLTSSQTGKMMYQLDCSAHSTAQICCLGWGYNFLDVDAVKVNIHKLRGVSNLEDVTNLGSQAKPSDFPDLPTDLAFLDVENMMPKLSTLPAGGQE